MLTPIFASDVGFAKVTPRRFSLASSTIAEVIMDPVVSEFEADARMAAEDCPKAPLILKMAKNQIHQRHLAQIARMM